MSEPAREGKGRRRALIVLIGVALVAGIWWLWRGRSVEEEEEVEADVVAETTVAEVKTFEMTLSVLGTVEPRPGSVALVAAPAASRVTRVFVGVGDRVSAGQPLVALDESIWAAQTNQAEAAQLAAQQAYDRSERLVREGISPRRESEAAAAALAETRAALTEARQRQSLGVLRSPIGGVVTVVTASLSQAVDVDQPLVEVVNPNGLEVVFHLSPQEAGQIAQSSRVELTTGVDSARTTIGRARVAGVSAAVDSLTGSVDVRAVVESTERALKSGESVGGVIVVAEHPNAVVVPASSIVPAEEGGEQVFVVDAEGIAHATPVTLGGRNGDDVEIASGLHGGEKVVAEGAYGVSDGAHIQAAEPE